MPRAVFPACRCDRQGQQRAVYHREGRRRAAESTQQSDERDWSARWFGWWAGAVDSGDPLVMGPIRSLLDV